jgi:hypothetical protein
MSETATNVSTNNQDTPPRIFRPWELSPQKTKRSLVGHLPLFHMMELQSHSSCATPVKGTHDARDNFECDGGINYQPQSTKKKQLNPRAVEMMELWYAEHFEHPYPSDETIGRFVRTGGITVTQVKKWMANKRVRSNNTLSFNGNIHPKRLQRLRKEYRLSSPPTLRSHPYQSFLYKNAWKLRLNCELSTNPLHVYSPLRLSPIRNDILY